MKAEINLTVDTITGSPMITIRHHDKSDAIEQKLLGIFIKQAKEKGLEINNINGYIECGTSNSWENYVIRIK